MIALGAAVSVVRGALGLVPREVWFALAVILLLGLGKCVHDRKVDALADYVRAERDKEWQGAFDQMRGVARVWRARYEGRAAALSAEIGESHAQELTRNSDRADAQRLRGPGRAQPDCRPGGDPELPAAAGGDGPAAGGADARLDGVPAGVELAIVPWDELVTRAEHADDNRAEVAAWRDWYARQQALWDASKRELPAVD